MNTNLKKRKSPLPATVSSIEKNGNSEGKEDRNTPAFMKMTSPRFFLFYAERSFSNSNIKTGPYHISKPKSSNRYISPKLIILNATIWTGNEEKPWSNALVIRGEKIISIGTTQEIETKYLSQNESLSPSITIINGTDLFVVPEFIATHIHLINGGTNLSSFQFRKISSREQFTQAIETFVSNFEKEKWTFHESNWNYTRLEGTFSDKCWINNATSENPIFLIHQDGHMGLANSLILQLANITKEISNIEEGLIVSDTNGERTPYFFYKLNFP